MFTGPPGIKLRLYTPPATPLAACSWSPWSSTTPALGSPITIPYWQEVGKIGDPDAKGTRAAHAILEEVAAYASQALAREPWPPPPGSPVPAHWWPQGGPRCPR